MKRKLIFLVALFTSWNGFATSSTKLYENLLRLEQELPDYPAPTEAAPIKVETIEGLVLGGPITDAISKVMKMSPTGVDMSGKLRIVKGATSYLFKFDNMSVSLSAGGIKAEYLRSVGFTYKYSKEEINRPTKVTDYYSTIARKYGGPNSGRARKDRGVFRFGRISWNLNDGTKISLDGGFDGRNYDRNGLQRIKLKNDTLDDWLKSKDEAYERAIARNKVKMESQKKLTSFNVGHEYFAFDTYSHNVRLRKDNAWETSTVCSIPANSKLKVIEKAPSESLGVPGAPKVRVLDGRCEGKEGWLMTVQELWETKQEILPKYKK